MRASLILSLFVHGAAVAAVLGVSAYAGRRSERPAPRVEVMSSTASAPGAPAAVESPQVVVEASPPERLSELVVEATFAQPEPAATREPFAPRPAPTLARVRPLPVPKPEPPAPAPAPPQAFVDASPLSDNEPPRYPDHDRQQGHEGTVVIAVSVDRRGDVVTATLRKASAHPGLNREALRAVRSWRFQPALREGVPVAADTEVWIEFHLLDRDGG